MGKRSEFERIEKDRYVTPYAGVVPLIPFLPPTKFSFAEPCANDGSLIQHIRHATDKRAQCYWASDVEPRADWVKLKDARDLNDTDMSGIDMIITNPPWDRSKASGYLLHNLIETFSALAPTWLLFDADWFQTKQARPYLDILAATVSVGRLKWIPGTTQTGKDNCQWYLFDKNARDYTPAPLAFGRNHGPSKEFAMAMEGYRD